MLKVSSFLIENQARVKRLKSLHWKSILAVHNTPPDLPDESVNHHVAVDDIFPLIACSDFHVVCNSGPKAILNQNQKPY